MKGFLNIKAKVKDIKDNYRDKYGYLSEKDCVILQFVGEGWDAMIAYKENNEMRITVFPIVLLNITDISVDL